MPIHYINLTALPAGCCFAAVPLNAVQLNGAERAESRP